MVKKYPPIRKEAHIERSEADHKVYQRYAQAIGALFHDWNHAHTNLMRLFCWLFDRTSGLYSEAACAAWNSVRTESTQREMLCAAARVILNKEPEALGELLWGINEFNRLSEWRNAAAHTPLHLSATWNRNEPEIFVADRYCGSPRVARIADADVLKIFR